MGGSYTPSDMTIWGIQNVAKVALKLYDCIRFTVWNLIKV